MFAHKLNEVIWVQGKHQNVQGGGTPEPGPRKPWFIHANSHTVIFCHCSYECHWGVHPTWFCTQRSLSFSGLFTFLVFLFELRSGGGLTDEWSLQVSIWLALFSQSSLRLALLQLPPLLQPESSNMTWHYGHQNETWAQWCGAVLLNREGLHWNYHHLSLPHTPSPPRFLSCSVICNLKMFHSAEKYIISENVGISLLIEEDLQFALSEVREKARQT